MTTVSDPIDMRPIMETIKANAKERLYVSSAWLSFDDIKGTRVGFDKNDLQHHVEQVDEAWHYDWYDQMPGSGFILFVKKVIRKIIGSVMKYFVNKQLRFNLETLEALKNINGYIQYEEERNNYTDEQDELLSMRTVIDDQKKQIMELEKRVAVLTSQVDAIEEQPHLQMETELAPNKIRE